MNVYLHKFEILKKSLATLINENNIRYKCKLNNKNTKFVKTEKKKLKYF